MAGGRWTAAQTFIAAIAACAVACSTTVAGSVVGSSDAPRGHGSDAALEAAAVDAGTADGGIESGSGPTHDPKDGAGDVEGAEAVAARADAAAFDASASVDGDAAGSDAADGGGAEVATDAVASGASPVWDLALLQDPVAAGCAFTDKHPVYQGLAALDAWKVKYTGLEFKGGKLQPIAIRGFAARPSGGAKLPGVVVAHGLGGMSKEGHATELAARLGMFVLAYTGPGGGDAPDNSSEGDGAQFNKGYKMFDVLADVRGSWFWGHAAAAMRAATCLQHRPDVDATKLGITGFSAGGVISLLVAGHDPRVGAAAPMSGTLAWAKATESPKAWQHALLAEAGLSIASAEWQKLQADLIAPAAALAGAKAQVLMLNGTTDEFFPLSAHLATFSALPGAGHRTSLAANFDHGCYAITGIESKAAIEARAKLRAEGGQKMWFSHWLGGDGAFSYLPLPPQVTVQAMGGATLVAAVVDGGGATLEVEKVEFWASGDDAFFFAGAALEPKAGLWSKLVSLPLPANAVWYADVQYKTKAILPQRFSISSPPVIPAGHVPKIRGIKDCQ